MSLDFEPADDGKAALHLEPSGVAGDGSETTSAHWKAFLDVLTEML